MATFLSECARSRFGWLLATIHALWFYLGVRSMGPPSRAAADFLGGMQGADWTLFAGRPFHYVYQSWILKSLILVDMPAMLVGFACGLLLWPLSIIKPIPIYEASYISAGILFVLATGQWLIVGHLLQKRFRPKSV
jgi:hypothetical protein